MMLALSSRKAPARGLALGFFVAASVLFVYKTYNGYFWEPSQEQLLTYLRNSSEPLDPYLLHALSTAKLLYIQAELRNYIFHPDLNAKGLPDLQLVHGKQPARNWIVSTWRSGSTFLGDLLLSHPATFYHYEPLLPYGIVRIRGGILAESAVRDLKKLFSCNYSDMGHYFQYGAENPFLFSHNEPVWSLCSQNFSFCNYPSYHKAICEVYPFQNIKTVRLQLHLVEEFLANKGWNLQVLLLVRDPRGTMQSRQHRDWCPGVPDCDEPKVLCDDLVDDYYAAEKLIRRFPNTFRVARYEDISFSIYKQSQELLNFFRMQFDKNVLQFLETHTKQDRGGVSSTFRNSTSAPIHWKDDLTWDEVSHIQNSCKTALKLWGYNTAKNKHHLKNFNPVGVFKKFSWKV